MLSRLANHRFWQLLAALAAVCAYPAFYVYGHNLGEARLVEVLPPSLTFLAIGLIAWLLFRILSGSLPAGAFAALLFMFVFMHYVQIEAEIRKLLPDWRWWRTAPAALFLLINLALVLHARDPHRKRAGGFHHMTLAIGALFLVLGGVQAVRGMHALARAAPPAGPPAPAAAPQAEPAAPAGPAARRPNFYFFIFDEYARQDVLQKYTGYDNTPFLRSLESMGFHVDYSGHAASSSTRACLANLLLCSTLYTNLAGAPVAIPRPLLLESFRNAGYRICLKLHMNYQISRDLIDVEFKTTTVLTSMSLEQTVAEASFLAFLRGAGNEGKRADALGLFRQVADAVAAGPGNPQFVFVHFMQPHEPFIFDDNGDPVAYENMHNWLDPAFYVGQLRWTSRKITELAAAILEADPGAVVLIQSDHGARYLSGRQDEAEKRACLNVLYLGGQRQELAGVSTVNTLRLALNYALQAGWEMEPD